MSGSKTVSGFSIILILKGVITFQSFQECNSPQAPPPPPHTKSGKGYPQAKLLLEGGWQRPVVPTWAINSTFRTAKAASNGNRTKVSLKLTSRVNLGTRVTRAPSSPLWTQPTSPPTAWKGLKSKSPCILLNKNMNFDKNEMELKMENPTHSFRETNRVLHLM